MRSLRLYWGLLHTYIRAQAGKVALLALLVVGSTALQLAQPQIIRRFIDTAVSGSTTRNLAVYGLIYIGVALVAQLVVGLTRYLGDDIGWVATNRLREDLTRHCLRLDMSFHKRRTSGEMIERIDGDASLLSNFLSKFAVDVMRAFLLLAGALLLLLRESLLVGFSMTGFVIFAVAVLIYLTAVATRRSVRLRGSVDEYFGFLGETLESREDLKANSATGYVMKRVHDLTDNWFGLRLWSNKAQYAMQIFGEMVAAMGSMLALGLGAYLWHRHMISLGTVFIIYQYAELMNDPVEYIREQFRDLQQAGAGVQRIQELLTLKPALVSGERALTAAGPVSISLTDVNFEYEFFYIFLRHISLEVAPGRVIGVLGRTGSGKTTLANLIGRLYDISGGAMLLDGVPVKSLDVVNLRKRVAVVTQNVQLFQGTVRDNVSLFDPSVDDDRILRAVDAAGLTSWLAAQPDGLSAEIHGAGGLSAGQAQLLAFARVMLRDPGLVILDEASSRLDPATEDLLGSAMRRLLLGRTGMIIAHRLASLELADDILILENGEIVEYGERLTLARDPSSRYSRLLRAGMEELLA